MKNHSRALQGESLIRVVRRARAESRFGFYDGLVERGGQRVELEKNFLENVVTTTSSLYNRVFTFSTIKILRLSGWVGGGEGCKEL